MKSRINDETRVTKLIAGIGFNISHSGDRQRAVCFSRRFGKRRFLTFAAAATRATFVI
jgi:hypothetical protein